MGEAFLHGHGSGLRFRRLSASLDERYSVFYNEQTIDISHAVIYANLGSSTIKIAPEDCTVSPRTASSEMTSVSVSYTIGSITRSAQIPITVIPTSSVFNENSWEVIAQAAYYGFPKFIWNLGDTKTENVDGTYHSWRIIGFDHDDLNENDAKYSDPLYNNGIKKAALSIQWKTPAGCGPMVSFENRANNGLWWRTCDMRSKTLPALLNSMPEGLKNNVRTVDKWNSGFGVYNSSPTLYYKDPETIFLLDHFDSNYVKRYIGSHPPEGIDEVIAHWRSLDKYYPYFSSKYIIGNYRSYSSSEGEWSRTKESPCQFFCLDGSGASLVYAHQYNKNLPYFPVFNF